MRAVFVVVVAALVAGTVVSDATAAARPWPGRTISYYDQSRVWRWSVREAVAAWNATGLRIRFVRARSARAAHVVVSTRRLPRLRGTFVAGRATLGYVPGRRAVVHLMQPSEDVDRFAMARVAAHELGHVLGLRHTRASCALMIRAGSVHEWGRCTAHRRSQWRCRLVERDDLRRALRLYGGRPRRLREPPVCFKHEAPAAPDGVAAELAATESGLGWSVRGTLAWRNPDSRSFAGVRVEYAAGSCPARPGTGAVLLADADDSFAGIRRWERRRGARSEAVVSLDGLAPGTYCFAVWSTDEAAARHSRAPATAEIAVGAAAPQPRIA